MAYPPKNRLVLAKIEDDVGVDALPTVGANAVRVIDAGAGVTLETSAIDEETGSLDNNVQVANGGFTAPSLRCVLRGSGVPAVPPDYGVFLRACGLTETIIAADVTGTATAGAAGSITVESGDLSADGQYVGGIIELTGGTGYSASDHKQNRRVIIGSVNSTKVISVYPNWSVTPDETTQYAIRAAVIYRPTSVDIKSATGYFMARSDSGDDTILKPSLGMRSTFNLTLPVRNVGTIAFDARGALQAPMDIPDPGAPTLQDSKPISWMDAQTYLGSGSICPNQLTIDYGGEIVNRECPNEIYGYREASIARRRITGTINPDAVTIATRNVFAAWAAQTGDRFWTAYGPTPGNRVSIHIPQLIYGGAQDQDINGFLHDQIPWLAGGKDGDTLMITFF